MARPIVVTSINPYARLPQQLRCFAAWKALGVSVRTVNIEEERDRLLEAGMEPSDIELLAPERSGLDIHGSAVPRILPLLEALRDSAENIPVMLVNSDLYPAMRSAEALTHWTRLAEAVALTREECAAPETCHFADFRPYRGGLDAFVFSAACLDRLIAALRACTAGERMCFGIPGWDYLMGAVITSGDVAGGQVSGRIMDSGLLLHESHPTTYGNLAEFEFYMADMDRVARTGGEEVSEVAEAFNRRIEDACRDARRDRDLARALYFRQPVQDLDPPRPAARAIAAAIARVSPPIDWHLRRPDIAQVAEREIAAGRVDYNRAQNLFLINPDPQYRFAQRLQAIAFSLMCRRAGGGIGPLATEYPPNSLHARTVEMIRTGYPEGSAMTRTDFADLFGAELVEHGIFNTRLFDYLALACETDEERGLVALIRDSLSDFLPGAAAAPGAQDDPARSLSDAHAVA